MTITAQSGWREQSITEAQFSKRARDRWPSYVLSDIDPAWAYGRCVHHRVDANLVIEIFDHESTSGRAGTALETHSAGNTREPTFGDVPKRAAGTGFNILSEEDIRARDRELAQQDRWRSAYGKPDTIYYYSAFGQAAGRSGYFARFRNWRDGWESTVARLSAEEWAYAKLRTIAEVIETWAPGHDMNDPESYTGKVVAGMNRNAGLEVDDVPTGLKPPMIDYPSPNKNGYDASDGMTNPRTIEAVCCHIGTSTKASNLGWLTNPASGASCNAYVDKQGQIYELVPKASAAWTAGRVNKPDLSNPIIKRWIDNGWNPNTRLYNIEHEGEPSDDLTDAQIASTSRIIAWVASEEDFPIDREHVIGHYQIDSVDRMHCPSFSDAEWRRLIDGAKAIANGGGPVDETAREINGYTVRGAFLAAYQQLELDGAHWWTFGLPTGADVPGVLVDGIERTVQPFDRAGWVMTEGGGVVIAKPGQAKQINAALGIETGADVRVAAVREAARAARDHIDVILSEVAD